MIAHLERDHLPLWKPVATEPTMDKYIDKGSRKYDRSLLISLTLM